MDSLEAPYPFNLQAGQAGQAGTCSPPPHCLAAAPSEQVVPARTAQLRQNVPTTTTTPPRSVSAVCRGGGSADSLTHRHLLHRRWTRCTRSTRGGGGGRERVPLPPWSPFYPACVQLQQKCRDGRKERSELLTGSRERFSKLS